MNLCLRSYTTKWVNLRVERVLNLIRDWFYCPKMQREVEHSVTHVCSCLRSKHPNKVTQAPLTITTTYPFELVSIDFLHLEKRNGVYECILAVLDHFTHFKSAKTAVQNVHLLYPRSA